MVKPKTKKNRMFFPIMMFVLSLSVSCAGTPPSKDVPMGKVSPDDHFVLARLSKTADSIDRHVRNLERESLRNIHIKSLPAPTGSAAYRITMNFDGPVEEALRTIGMIIHYKVYMFGQKPSVPILVSVHMKGRSAQSVIDSIGLQTGRSVGIRLDEIADRIELVYRNTGTRNYPLFPGEKHPTDSDGDRP